MEVRHRNLHYQIKMERCIVFRIIKGKKLFYIFNQKKILRVVQSRRVDTVNVICRLKKKMQLFLESARIVLHHIRNLKKNRD